MINPANRNNSSQVTNTSITSPLNREGKKNLRSRLREATATVWLSPSALRHRGYYSIFFSNSQ